MYFREFPRSLPKQESGRFRARGPRVPDRFRGLARVLLGRRYARRMCGIAGFAGEPRPDEALLERMAETMWKRGPDGHGTWRDGSAGLAATRLMVIDLHERSNRPLHLGALHLVFNGELYNYKELRQELRGLGHEFATEGDAEVLLHAWSEWGEGALDRAN